MSRNPPTAELAADTVRDTPARGIPDCGIPAWGIPARGTRATDPTRLPLPMHKPWTFCTPDPVQAGEADAGAWLAWLLERRPD